MGGRALCCSSQHGEGVGRGAGVNHSARAVRWRFKREHARRSGARGALTGRIPTIQLHCAWQLTNPGLQRRTYRVRNDVYPASIGSWSRQSIASAAIMLIDIFRRDGKS
ncbi:hypothetical protein chiPu_0016789 [Chiloscyllium punctatum]|uniref:Uncharacterized protein n=1 Tax=Chiloscyllium punctatum TaxID=137246 RepID=A0A401T6M0_CHIPU|nr:hypothetical protein [Chiloscyllium punctatum]